MPKHKQVKVEIPITPRAHSSKQSLAKSLLAPGLAAAITALVLVSAYYLAGKKSIGTASANEKLTSPFNAAPAVAVAQVSFADVPVYLAALGSVTSTNSVVIRSQVSGRLMRIAFEEGQMVEENALIAEIDARPFQAQLLQIQGQLARDRALLLNAKLDLERYKKLIKKDAVSQQTLDTQEALVKQYEGNVDTDLGQIDAAELNLDYCKIRSPIAGRAGLQLVDAGNLVQVSDAKGIVSINTVQPINVLFAIPEDKLTTIAQKIAANEQLKVEVYDRNQNKLLATGVLVTMDNHIDANTGTIKLKAQFDNNDSLLFPNQFVNVKLLVEVLPQVPVVPSQAVQHGVNGTFVYVVKDNTSVKLQPVNVAMSDGKISVVDLSLGVLDKVVISGVDKLKDGCAITIIPNASEQYK